MCAVTRQELGGEGPVVAIALHATPDTDLLLVVHAASGAVVWDMRCACWSPIIRGHP